LSLFLLVILLYPYSPSDSVRSLVTLCEVPERALLFAELAARDGGQASVDYALLLEAAGRFAGAGNAYRAARGWSEDQMLTAWLTARILGTARLDTTIALAVVLRNPGNEPVEDIHVEVPCPVPHPPYQEMGVLQWDFTEEDGFLRCRIDRMEAGSTRRLPIILRVRQEPWTFRPIADPMADGALTMDSLGEVLRSVSGGIGSSPEGPCLEAAMKLALALEEMGVHTLVTGGLLRSSPDSLTFHAWNILDGSGMPMDAVLFAVDSLRGVGHSSTDLIPLWDLGASGGHEVSVLFSGDPDGLEVNMEVSFLDGKLLDLLLGSVPLLSCPPDGSERFFQ
jgi:hypothetical protein